MKSTNPTQMRIDEVAVSIRNLHLDLRYKDPAYREAFIAKIKEAHAELSNDPWAGKTRCYLHCDEPEQLKKLRKLIGTEMIVLMTPVLTPRGQRGSWAPYVDPFESFGRACSAQHSRICHVPYVPKMGFTDTHAEWVAKASAIIIVMCEPDDPKGREESLKNQRRFAEVAADVEGVRYDAQVEKGGCGAQVGYSGKTSNNASNNASNKKSDEDSDQDSEEEVDDDSDDEPTVVGGPVVLVQCGSGIERVWSDEGFANIVHADTYDDDMARDIAQAIFRGLVR